MLSSEPILIIGAGLGGLALAKSLHTKKIPFRIFEREPQHGARGQGWAISLHQWLMNDLCSATCTDEDHLRAMSTSAPLGLPSQAVVYSLAENRRTEVTRFGEGTDKPFERVERAKLRDWLLQDAYVEWEKRFKGYEERLDGVTAHFEDGTEARGCILVGADGISSRVRRQILRGLNEPTRLPIALIVGEVDATPEQYQQWLKLGTSFSVGLTDTKRLFVGLKQVSEDLQSARFYWMFCWPDENATNTKFWTFNASQSQMHSFVTEGLQGLDPEYVDPFLATPVEGILQTPLRMCDMVPPPIPRGRVSLLGDAMHPMVPFRGEGGNMAIKDGLVLAELLMQKAADEDFADVLKAFESEMRKRARDSVIRSRESAFMHKEVISAATDDIPRSATPRRHWMITPPGRQLWDSSAIE